MTRFAKDDPYVEAIFKHLAALSRHSPALAEPLAFYRAALPLLHEAQASVTPFVLPPDTAQSKLESGVPLLVGEELPLDVEATRDLFMRLCRLAESRGSGARASAARQIRQAVERHQLDLPAVWAALALGDDSFDTALMADLQIDRDLLRILAEHSLKPSLRMWAQDLQKNIDLDDWRRGQCPLCGSRPLLAEIQGKEGARRLRCGVCGASWYYPRLQCAFCGNDQHRTLGTISVEGEEEKYRAQTCDQCQGYLKIVVTFDPIAIDLLTVEDLATLHLDWIATERGYARARLPVGVVK